MARAPSADSNLFISKMRVCSILLLTALIVACALAELPRGAHPSEEALYSAAALECSTLTGRKEIAQSLVNDNYCDCELDGLDEPGLAWRNYPCTYICNIFSSRF